ncbi:MAG: tetratricopeptide repeat protein [Thermodesulfobacteriota bacterium]|nr:tetratricopeptide repeat protein [Thermodesulfobacteriota bacterium]
MFLSWVSLGLVATVLLLTFPSEAKTNGWEELFFKANQAYKEGRFHEAVDGYGRLLDSGHKNGQIYYNLGNAHFRLNRIGQAILNYERAYILMPRDADLNFNLGFARDQTQDAISQPKGFMETTFFWLHTMTLHELSWGFVVVNLFFWAVLLVRLFRPSEWTFYASLILLVLWLLAGASFGVKYFQEQTDDRAVILAEEADVLAGPATEDTLLFKLHEGAIVLLERSEDGWSLVSLSDNKRGWVQKKGLEKINDVTS